MRNLGYSWSVNTVVDFERGRRDVTLRELVGICDALRVSVADLLDDHGYVKLAARTPVCAVIDIRQALAGDGFGDDMLKFVLALRDDFFADDEPATRKAAQQLGVSPQQLDEMCRGHYGRPFIEERDSRIPFPEPRDPRTRQALRGHATRKVLAELSKDVEGGP